MEELTARLRQVGKKGLSCSKSNTSEHGTEANTAEITEARPAFPFGRSHRLAIASTANGVSLLSAIMASSPLLRSALCQPRRGTFLCPASPSTTKANILISGLHTTSVSRAITKFKMPAMSPTMTEGGIASWKKREGDSFTAGDVLLEIVCHKQR